MLLGGSGVTKPTPGQIKMFPVKDPESKDTNWYKITIDEGVLIQGNTEEGLMDAAKHLIELLEGTGDDLRLPMGIYTPNHTNKKQ